MRGRSLVGLAVALMALGCEQDERAEASPDGDVGPSADAQAGDTPDAGPAGGPTYHGGVSALVEQHCLGCHAEGGAGPFRLDGYDNLKIMAGPALAAIQAGRMPPWHADPECRRYDDERLLSDADKALFAAWVEAGAPLGEARNAGAEAQTAALPEPDRMTQPLEPYVPASDRPDDYRCFPLDVTFERDAYIAGTNVIPGDRAIVHHVLVYAIGPADAGRLDQLDAAEEGPGYTCYGGPGVGGQGGVGPVAAWVPGMGPAFQREGDMLYFPAGTRLVMQVHYNTLATDPAPDLTTLALYTWDEPQPNVITSRPQAHLDIVIPAGEARSEQVREFVNRGREPLVVVGVGPHMHVLGTQIRVDVVREDGGEECLVNIPAWDFNWQQNYRFRAGEEAVVNPGDRFRLTCVYDNSVENQPVINGEQLEPRQVTWGEGTLDEMCLNYIQVRQPFAPSGAACAGADECRAACADRNSVECVGDCYTGSADCSQCTLRALIGNGGCARQQCLGVLAGAQQCFQTCITEAFGAGSSLFACMAVECPAQYEAVAGCLEPLLASGACDPALAACGA